MAQRPTPQQFLIRRVLAVIVLFAISFGAFKIIQSSISFVSDAFAQQSEPTETPQPSQSSPSYELQKCNDEDISVAVGFEGKTSFTSEEVIVIDATFTLMQNGPCLRDVGARANEIYVVNSENKKVWSTNTCPVNNKSNLVEMNSGNTYRTTITWAGTVDPKECGKEAKHLSPGTYGIYASNGNAVSERAAITFE